MSIHRELRQACVLSFRLWFGLLLSLREPAPALVVLGAETSLVVDPIGLLDGLGFLGAILVPFAVIKFESSRCLAFSPGLHPFLKRVSADAGLTA